MTDPFAPDYPAWRYNIPQQSPTIDAPAPSPTFGAPSAPHPGQGPFGLVPGPIGDVSNIAYDDLLKRLPGLAGLNATAASGVLSRLQGNLSPETQARLQDIGARFGVSSGMPGGQMSRFRTARDLGRATEDIQRAGLQDFGSLLQDARAQTVSPETQIGARERDLDLAAAPDPTAQASYAQQLFNQYANLLSRGGGGRSPAGGTGNPFQDLVKQLSQRNPAGGTSPTPAPSPTGGGTADTAPWYDPTMSDESQWNAMFPDEPWGVANPAVDYPQYNSDIENWQNSDYEWLPGMYTNPATDTPFDYSPIG